MMNMKQQVVVALALLLTGIAVGRYTVPKGTTEVKVDTAVEKNRDVVTHSDTTVTKAPDGTTTTHTVVDKDSTTKVDVVSHQDTTVTQKRSTLNVSVLVATKVDDLRPFYGVSVSKEVFGPVTIGAFGLTNGTAGLSVGLDF